MSGSSLRRLVITAMFTALVFLGTFFLKIPIPLGYVHLGDAFIFVAAVLLPMPFAVCAAAAGSALADVMGGFVAYAPWTVFVKAAMVIWLSGSTRKNRYIAYMRGGCKNKEYGKKDMFFSVLCAAAAGIINVCGYFLADSVMLSPAAAIGAIPMNAAQSACALLLSGASLSAFSRALKL